MVDVGYPGHWEADVVLRDGTTAHVRPIRPDDDERLRRFHDAQSAQSTYFRFFAAMPHLSDRDVARFTVVDHVARVALVVTLADVIVGVGRYERLDPAAEATAEIAFNISDAHQGRGIGSVLLEHLAAAARENRIGRFEAVVLPDNSRMLSVFREAGYDVTHSLDDGIVTVAFDLDPTVRSVAVMEAREHRAEARSMKALLYPQSVAVIGASRRAGAMGRRILDALLGGGYTGLVHVVHRDADAIAGQPVLRRIGDAPAPVDLAVIAVPAADAVDVVAHCAAAGVRGAVVVSGGFAEAGPDGSALQSDLVRVARANGMRIVGPNSFGLVNTDPTVLLNVSIAPVIPQHGRLALFSQSGALGVAILASIDRRGLGISSFVSAGNRADVSGNDCLQFWADDPRTSVVGMYLESVGNPRKFSRVARALARRKPVVVVKSGVSEFGVPPGHAVRSSHAPPGAFDAMLRQAGVIRTENLHQLFDVAQILLAQPRPRGQRIAVVGNSAALAALAADACVSWRLDVVASPESVPLDAGLGAVADLIRRADANPDVDAIVVCLVPPLDTDEIGGMAQAMPAQSTKTTIACVVGARALGGPDGAPAVPAYPLPEDAVRALAAVVRYTQWLRRESGPLVERTWAPDGQDGASRVGPGVSGVAAHHARNLIDEVLTDEPRGRELTRDEATRLLQCYGLRLWPQRIASDPSEAVVAADELGWPVVVKAAGLRHRSDTGGVRLAVSNATELRADVAELQATLGDAARQVIIQAMAPTGVACRITTAEDPLFGPLVSFAIAGETADLLGDVAYRIPPLRTTDVADLVRGVRAAPLLFGHGGRATVDVTALETALSRASLLAEDLPQVSSLVLQPVLAHAAGCEVLDATVRVAPAPSRTDSQRRALPPAVAAD